MRWGDIALVDGRLPDPSEAGEILVTQRFAAETGLDVGDQVDVVLLTEAATDVVGLVATPDQGRPMRLEVTGSAWRMTRWCRSAI